jgi:hypothetical protein
MVLTFALALMLALTLRGQGRAAEVDLQLVLAVDVSGSVSQQRFELQRQGYADAFRDPRVLAAVLSGPHQAIAATLVQWTGPALQIVALPWRRLHDRASLERFAGEIAQMPRLLYGGGTSISGAIDAGVGLLGASPYKGARRVIDISGDGANNRGRPVTAARDEAVAGGVVINGLPILALEPDLDAYYEQSVIGGPGAFVIAAKDYDSFGQAILRKLITEIAGRPAPRRQVVHTRP